MLKKKLNFLLIVPLLCAFQCDDEVESSLVFNVFKAEVTPELSFSIEDTIWISGKTSSKAFDLSVNDSIVINNPQSDVFSIFKFIQPTAVSNCKDAIDKFELIIESGQFSFLPLCENAQLQVLPELESNNMSYSYRIGLKPNTTGDYVISWKDGVIQNSDRNEFIIDNYPIENHPNQIGFNSCGNISWRFLNESDKEYYFSVQ